MTHEEIRLSESAARKKHWTRWGPYLSDSGMTNLVPLPYSRISVQRVDFELDQATIKAPYAEKRPISKPIMWSCAEAMRAR